MPIGPPAATPMIAPPVKPASPRFAAPSLLFGDLAKAGFTARLIANTPATSAGLRNFVVQVPMFPLQLLRNPRAVLLSGGHFNAGSGSPSGAPRAIRR